MISYELCSALAARYGVNAIHKSDPLAGGDWKTLLRLETDRGAFVLSLSHPGTAIEGLAFEHSLLTFLSRSCPEVPAPLPGCDGTTYFWHDGRLAALFPFMPGEMADEEQEEVRLEAARMLARFHRASVGYPPAERPGLQALRDFDWNQNAWWSWGEIETLLSPGNQAPASRRFLEDGTPYSQGILARKTQIAEAKDELAGFVARLTLSGRPLVFAPTHGDYYSRNLLLANNRVTALVDWDDCRPDWLGFELARALLALCGDSGGEGTLSEGMVDRFLARAGPFLEAYHREGGPVSNSEFDLLVPFMKCGCLMDTLFSFGAFLKGAAWNPAHAEFHRNNLVALETLEKVRLFE